ncbi:hypothetical protein [Halomonas huangheensis]|uniref:Uncharacterized protein n=1 Tax=Halomonas huangheensis TaxID=1178482 RepID=W1N7N3_9GAMM|nr:hypothetical protein [Halomonas huangheensis]ERL50910.1 hypothetical protein BJB45_20140 [Halomonas huangheensis]
MDIVSRYAQTFLLQRYDEGLLAESDPTNKDTMIRLIMNMLASEEQEGCGK